MEKRIIQGIEFNVVTWQELPGFNGKECVDDGSDQSDIALLLRSQKPLNTNYLTTVGTDTTKIQVAQTGGFLNDGAP